NTIGIGLSRPIGIGVPRRLHNILFLLRGLSLVPAGYSFISFIYAASKAPADNVLELSTELDYWLGAMWCLLAGLWSYWLADGLMRRWLFYYEITSAIIRLISLQAINWVITAFVISNYGHDEPVWTWVICSIVLAISNVIQWLFTSTAKHYKPGDPEASKMTLREILRYIILPLAIASFITMMCLLHQQSKFRHRAITSPVNYKLNANLSLSEINTDAEIKVIMVILSSWTERGYFKRQQFRDTSIKLIPQNSNKVSIAYRFILGVQPTAKMQQIMGKKILAESEKYGDMVIVSSSDLYNDLSHKVYKGFEWANNHEFDYLIKTDDDMFIRIDTVIRELGELGPGKKYYWKGLGYWNIPPIQNTANKNSELEYPLPMFPPFTAGALYILSRDIISLVVIDAPRLFTKNEDQNLGIWLFPYNIKPIHDKRIQQADVCEDDMIAKHFSDSYEPDRSMIDMYENVINNRRLCEGFRQHFCALCYPCAGRANHWKDWNFDCDNVKGITLLHQTNFLVVNPKESSLVFDESVDAIMGSKEDEWIIPGVLSQHSSVYSQTDQWYLLHWMIWTTDPSTFQERHYKTIELVWVHTPKAIIFVVTNTLPNQFFDDYQKQGYQIYVINFDQKSLLKRQWFLGINSKNRILDWKNWEEAPYFPYYLADYMRCVLLYKYGGMYMDMDALWVRAPPNTQMEFIGSDFSSMAADLEWTLDTNGTYLPNGVMRFRKGWAMFREYIENALSEPIPTSCFNCLGPRALTKYVKKYRKVLEENGLTILPSQILYPRDYIQIVNLLNHDPIASRELQKIEKESWSIHLYGKSTNSKLIEEGSVVDLLIKKFSLDIPHPSAPLVKDGNPDSINRKQSYSLRLEGPKTYQYVSTATAEKLTQYSGSLNGQFQGLNVIFVRGGPSKINKATINVSAQNGKISFNLQGGNLSKISMTINQPTMMDINNLLNSLVYRPSDYAQKAGGKDTINLEVSCDDQYDALNIEVIIFGSDEL
ncbi:19937_t:CDS:2, partial [Dentiscutata erythropus]